MPKAKSFTRNRWFSQCQKVSRHKSPVADISHCTRDVRFGSKADMCSANEHVRFTPNSDRESGHRQTVRSALPPKADMCSAQAHVCFGPKADMAHLFNYLIGSI